MVAGVATIIFCIAVMVHLNLDRKIRIAHCEDRFIELFAKDSELTATFATPLCTDLYNLGSLKNPKHWGFYDETQYQ